MRREERRGVGEIFISFGPRKESRKVVGTCMMCEQFWWEVVIARNWPRGFTLTQLCHASV
jgi:hypothetical protein